MSNPSGMSLRGAVEFLRYEVWVAITLIGRPRNERRIATAEDLRDARAIQEVLRLRYCGSVYVVDRETMRVV